MPNRGRLLRLLPPHWRAAGTSVTSSCPVLPERSGLWIAPLQWRRWPPGYNAAENLREVDAAIGAPDRWRAALGPYRATTRNTRPPAPPFVTPFQSSVVSIY